MTHEPMQCMRISMRVCEHDTNTPPSGNYFPLWNLQQLKKHNVIGTLERKSTHMYDKMCPKPPHATHLGQNHAPKRPRARHSNQNEAPRRPRAKDSTNIETIMMRPNAPVRNILAKMKPPDAPVRDIRRKLICQGTFIFKNGRFTLAGARFWKPGRARTGSEFMRERMLSLGMKKRVGDGVRTDEARSQWKEKQQVPRAHYIWERE